MPCACGPSRRTTNSEHARKRNTMALALSNRRSSKTNSKMLYMERSGTDRAVAVVAKAGSDGGDNETKTEREVSPIAEDKSLQELKARREKEKEEEAAQIEKGQRTAVFTGAIAIALGVAYLVLVSLLDSRGGELKPPPPEAFM